MTDDRAKWTTVKKLTNEQRDVLRAYAKANGRTWRSRLRTLWTSGQYAKGLVTEEQAAILRQVRNTIGSAGLDKIAL